MLLVKAWCGFAQLIARSCLTELLVHVICEEILYFGTFLSLFFADGLDLFTVAGMSTLVCPGLPDTFCHSLCCNTLFSLINSCTFAFVHTHFGDGSDICNT
jgi:hypothetical protein